MGYDTGNPCNFFQITNTYTLKPVCMFSRGKMANVKMKWQYVMSRSMSIMEQVCTEKIKTVHVQEYVYNQVSYITNHDYFVFYLVVSIRS